MTRRTIGRRRFVSTTAAASATVMAAPFVRTAHAAGKLSIGLWDHWVPSANAASKASSKSGRPRRRSTSRSTTSPRRARSC